MKYSGKVDMTNREFIPVLWVSIGFSSSHWYNYSPIKPPISSQTSVI